MDIYWRDSYTCPTEDEYRGMVQRSMSSSENGYSNGLDRSRLDKNLF